MFLHRVSIRPRHLDEWLRTWPEQLRALHEHGFVHHRAYLQQHAEPKLTWLYSHEDSDPTFPDLPADAAPHVFGNLVIRPVRVELLADVQPLPGRTVCLRRYSIVGGWNEFLAIWRQIVVVRERHGFRCLFAVADEPKDLFTWAFDFEGDWADLAAIQQPYYRDAERVALRRCSTTWPTTPSTPPVHSDPGRGRTAGRQTPRDCDLPSSRRSPGLWTGPRARIAGRASALEIPAFAGMTGKWRSRRAPG